MEGTSSASSSMNFPSTAAVIDELYFSAFHDDAEEMFPISDERYAEELQLQEVLYSSTTSSAARVVKEVVQVDVDVDVDVDEDDEGNLVLRTLKGKQKETGEDDEGDLVLRTLKGKQTETGEDDEGGLALRTLKGKQKETGGTSHTGETSHTLTYCGICMDAKTGGEMFRNQNCSHLYCDDCIGRHVAAKIEENILTVKCPEPKCKGVIEAQYCRSIIPKEVLDRWEDALCENVVHGSQKLYCPFKDCSAMMICDAGKVVTVSECPHCNRLFCAQCKVSWHPGANCREFQNGFEGEKEDQMVMELAKTRSWKRCPECKFYVERINGCTRISCRCGNEFCYACGLAWSSDKHYLCRSLRISGG